MQEVFWDEETKVTIVSAFKKLISKGYLMFLDDMSTELSVELNYEISAPLLCPSRLRTYSRV